VHATEEQAGKGKEKDPRKAQLDAQLQKALEEYQQLEERLQQKADYGPGRGDPLVYEWELTLAMKLEAQVRIQTIRQAIQNLEEGRYGICSECGSPIDPERMEIFPLASMCIDCARRRH
jgi:RNA polymerase-binding protein DksA